MSENLPKGPGEFPTVHGGRMHFDSSGSGRPLVLLHGLLGHSFSWRHVVSKFENHATVYLVDMPGSGGSEIPVGVDCSLRVNAQYLLGFLEAVKIEHCDVIASSYGGAVAMMAASIAPGRFQKLVLAAPVNPWSDFGRRRAAFFGNKVVAYSLPYLSPQFLLLNRWLLERMYGDPRRIDSEAIAGYSQPFRVRGAVVHKTKILRTWKRDLEELRTGLPKLRDLPTLLLWGTCDRAVDPASAEQLSQEFRDCRMHFFEGVGHLPYEEVPQEFSQVVLEFLGL